MIIPVRVDVLHDQKPLANHAVVGGTILLYAAQYALGNDSPVVQALILDGLAPLGLLGHMVLHADIFHLIGNMIFLWVFGNAVCAWLGNGLYPIFYVGAGLAAALTHVAFGGGPAVGASGAINGVVGLYLVLYPKNRVSIFWMLRFRMGVSEVPGILIILYWCLWDVVGIFLPMSNTAYFAHIGGFTAGLVTGLILLKVVPIEKDVEFRPMRTYRPDRRTVFRRDDRPGPGEGNQKPRPRLREPPASTRRRGRRPRPPGELQR